MSVLFEGVELVSETIGYPIRSLRSGVSLKTKAAKHVFNLKIVAQLSLLVLLIHTDLYILDIP